MTEEFGVTAWGAGWRRLAQPLAVGRPNPALPAARSLTRRDRVTQVAITAGTITATVDDRGPRRVDIRLPTWTDTQHQKAIKLLAEHAGGDELPDEAHTALRRQRLDPTPAAATIDADCDCTSRTRPCAHILAVYYETARRLDERPHLALNLRHSATAREPTPTSRIPLTRLDPDTFYVHRRAVLTDPP
jgi:uncharacterized Zn finger protein